MKLAYVRCHGCGGPSGAAGVQIIGSAREILRRADKHGWDVSRRSDLQAVADEMSIGSAADEIPTASARYFALCSGCCEKTNGIVEDSGVTLLVEPGYEALSKLVVKGRGGS